MRIFLAGASGVIGVRLVPLLIAAGHRVAGMTRSPEKASLLRDMGAQPVVCDVYDRGALNEAVGAFQPDLVMNQLTDLPDQIDQIAAYRERNNRIRTKGTRNLVDAATAAGAKRFLTQSIAWIPTVGNEARVEHERMVLEWGGVVVRYGAFYGPGTFSGDSLPPAPRIHVDEAARRTLPLLEADSGVVELTES